MNRLHLLGTGTPTPTRERFGTSCVLELSDDLLMFDCGPATTHKLVKAGLWPTRVDHLFFTHHHFDHNADYACFLLCRWDQSTGKENKLKVFGPEPTAWITEKLIGEQGAFVHDWKARCGAPVSQSVHANRGGALPRPAPSVQAKDVGPQDRVGGHGWSVTAAAARHVEPWLESLAYRVDATGGTIVFAGDTGPCEPVVDLAAGADVLVVNCWDHQDRMDQNGEAPGQTGTRDAGRMAAEAQVARLVLMHTGANLCRPGSREKAVADIAALYRGQIIFGEELMALDLW